MTKDPFTSLETFVSRLRQTHPTLNVSCDTPDSLNGSTWIDIRSGKAWTVVEYRPDLGFGFSAPTDEDADLYGTPSSFFVATADEALARVDAGLESAAASEVGGKRAARHGA